MDDIINQAFESVETAPVEATVAPIENEVTATEEGMPEVNTPEDVPFPKKAINALSRRDKQIGKLRAEQAADRAELQRYREQSTQKVNNAPREEDYSTYGEFLKAEILHDVNKGKAEESNQRELAESTAQQEQWLSERVNYVADRERIAAQSIPDYTHVINQNAEIIQSLPEHVRLAILEADAPELALYTLAKEGHLYDLADMSERSAMLLIGRAEARGEALSKQRTVSKAPTPLEGLKGSGGGKSINTMNSNELMKWLKT